MRSPDGEPFGMCWKCDGWIEAGTGRHEYMEFHDPVPAMPDLGVPAVAGVWTSVHKECPDDHR